MQPRLHLHAASARACIGDFPDAGGHEEPDGPILARGLNSGMSATTETRFAAIVGFEGGWSEATLVETRSPFAFAAGWRPPVNAYRCAGRFILFVDLAGIPPETITVGAHPRRVIVRGVRPAPEPPADAAGPVQLLALEIDHGSFERTLDLPQEIIPDDMTTDYRDGLLRIELPLKA